MYVPANVDESDPVAVPDMPTGRLVFLVGDCGRIEEVSTSLPLEQAQAEFTAQELAARKTDGGPDELEFMAEFERRFWGDESEGPRS